MINNNIIRCSVCESVIASETYFTYESKYYCEVCFHRHFRICSECGAVVLNELVDYCNECDREYCHSCYLSTHPLCDSCGGTACMRSRHAHRVNSNRRVCYRCQYHIWEYHDYNTVLPLQFHREKEDDTNEPYIGVELEMIPVAGKDRMPAAEDIIDIDPDDDLYHLENDRSVQEGFELVSHPCTLAYHQKRFPWAEVCKTALKNGMRSHDTDCCGLHLHLSRDFLSLSQQIRLGIFINLQIERMEIFGRRSSKRYARFKDIHETGLREANKNEKDRHEALNWENRNTIEFRFPRGTLKASTIYATIEFVHAVAHFVKNYSTPQIVDVEKSWGLFLDFILRDTEKYYNLISYLRERKLMR